MTTTSNLPEQAGESRRSASMTRAMAVAMGGDGSVGLASPKLRSLICPFCGELTADSGKCQKCSARFDPLSRQASQNEMGPWFVRDESMPYRPGCNYSTITRLVESGGIQANSVLRGPSTRQFWMLAKHTPGVGQLLGNCHNCGAPVKSDDFSCGSCHEKFSSDRDRQHLGLGPTRPLPGRGNVEVLAMHAEPPIGADSIQGPSAIPLGSSQRGSAEVASESTARQSDKLETISQVDELSRALSSLRRAWILERKRSWISVTFAGVISAIAIVVLFTT